jgi:hypothetical protein
MLFISDEFGHGYNYYEQNKAKSTTKIKPLAVFTKKRYSFIYRQFIHEPSIDTLAFDGFIGHIAGYIAVFYFSECIDYTAYAGINTSNDAQPVFDGPEDAYSHML